MKMFDMTQKDIEELINHNKSLKSLCCNHNIQCTDYSGPLYKSVNMASTHLKHYLNMLRILYYDKYKDANETDATMIFISIIVRIIAFYTHCWNIWGKSKSNDFLFDNKNYQIIMFTLDYLTNSCNIVCQVSDRLIKYKELFIEIGLKENQTLLTRMEIVSLNIKDQIEYILDNEGVKLKMTWKGHSGVSNKIFDYIPDLKNIKKTILDGIY